MNLNKKMNPLLSEFTEMSHTVLVFDVSNLLHRTFYANKNVDDVTTAGLAHSSALTTLNKYYKIYNPSKVIMTFDRSNWRKVYTKTDECVSGKLYKGNRRKDLTPKEQERYERFCEHLVEFEQIMRDHTSVVCLGQDSLEADDLMAGVVQHYSTVDPESKIIIVSQDKDLMQMLRYDNVQLVDPATGKHRDLSEFKDSADYFMYQKCIRGDTGDNVASAFPKVRATRIEKAFADPYEHEKLMNETWTNENKKTFKVKDLFEENKLLMDLSEQPQSIKDLIKTTVDTGISNPGKYSHFHFLKFCGKYELKRIADHLERYQEMLSR